MYLFKIYSICIRLFLKKTNDITCYYAVKSIYLWKILLQKQKQPKFLKFVSFNLRVVKVIWQISILLHLMMTIESITSASSMFRIHSLPNSHFHRYWVVLAELIVHSLENAYDRYSATFLLISSSFEWFIFHHWNCVWSIWSMNKHFQNFRWLSIFSSPNPSKLLNESFGLPRIFITICVDFF